jgi:hypothetical protein
MNVPEYDSLHRRGRSLEDAFFAKRDYQLAQALRRKLNAEETEHALATALGITDEQALKEVVKVEAGVPVFAVLALLPLVEVAWCDGEVSPKEEQAVLRAATAMGVQFDSPIYQLLQDWLKQRPSPKAVVAWRDFVHAICATLSPTVVARIKEGVMGRAESIAFAAGGILGIGNKVSVAERICLDDLAQAFDG